MSESCPKCGSDKIKKTYMGFNVNHAYCNSCKWSGRVHELTQRESTILEENEGKDED